MRDNICSSMPTRTRDRKKRKGEKRLRYSMSSAKSPPSHTPLSSYGKHCQPTLSLAIGMLLDALRST